MAALKEVTRHVRKYTVSTGAAETLKALTKKSRLHALEVGALKDELDAAVVEAVQLKEYERILDGVQDGEPVEALLVTLPEKHVGKGLYAVIHKDKYAKPGGPTQIIISVQSTSQVDFNRQNGKWRTQHEPGLPMQSLGSKLPQEKLKALLADATAKPVPVPTETTYTTAPPPPPIRFKLTWDGTEGAQEEIFTDQVSMKERMAELVETGGCEDILVYKEVLVPTWVEMKAKVRVQVDLE